MARFTGTVDVRASPQRVWQRLTDWPAHERWVPMTSITVLTENPGGVGARFVARSYAGLRQLGFDDTMEITEWQPPSGAEPGRCVLVKLGRVVLGSALLVVRELPSGLTRASWSEDVEIAPVRLTRRLAPLIGAGGRIAFGRALRKMAEELEREGAPEAP